MKRIIKFRGFGITKNELIADIIFLIIAFVISLAIFFIFDIHWSFYPGNTIFPPNKYIFKEHTVYYAGIPLGGIVGFFLLKVLFFAFMENEVKILKNQNCIQRELLDMLKKPLNTLNPFRLYIFPKTKNNYEARRSRNECRVHSRCNFCRNSSEPGYCMASRHNRPDNRADH